MTGLRCHGCGKYLSNSRKWCGEKCRKASYAPSCIDCGKKLSAQPAKRCVSCSATATGLARRTWPREVILDRIREWNGLHGEPPTASGWAAHRANDGQPWPSTKNVVTEFGSWNAGITAAGLEPRSDEIVLTPAIRAYLKAFDAYVHDWRSREAGTPSIAQHRYEKLATGLLAGALSERRAA